MEIASVLLVHSFQIKTCVYYLYNVDLTITCFILLFSFLALILRDQPVLLCSFQFCETLISISDKLKYNQYNHFLQHRSAINITLFKSDSHM